MTLLFVFVETLVPISLLSSFPMYDYPHLDQSTGYLVSLG